MHYVISDIHGCYKEFNQLLDMIHFSDDDILYILGDCIDRGPEPLLVLEKMSMYDNIIPIIGNHEFMFSLIIPKLMETITNESIEEILTENFFEAYKSWINDGGQVTIDKFYELCYMDKQFYLEYIKDFSLYEEVTVNGKDFLLVHSLPANYQGNSLLQYPVEDIIFGRFDLLNYQSMDKTIIVGHTPTVCLGAEYRGKIFKGNNIIDIDCGCFGGYPLACYCLENDEVIYSK